MPEIVSKIVLTDRFDALYSELADRYPEAFIVRIEADKFLVEHAQEAIEHAYLTSDKQKIVLLCSTEFTPIAQNKLLKIIEEPPPRTHFVLATPSKSSLLPTIRSRLVVEKGVSDGTKRGSGVDLGRFDLSALFELIQANRRTSAKEAKEIVEALGREVFKEGRIAPDTSLTDALAQSIRLLDMGSPPPFVLGRLGLKLLGKRR